MKTMKPHTIEPNWKQLPYNALYTCLEIHHGRERKASEPEPSRYVEPEQGFRTVPFKNRPLALDYMRRRKNDSLVRLAIRQLRTRWHTVK